MIVKTPETSFSFDLWERAVDFSPVVDFAVVSHVHDDHYLVSFLKAMAAAQKRVYSTFWTRGALVSGSAALSRASLKLEFRASEQVQFKEACLVTIADCGPQASGFRIMHTGDANRAAEFRSERRIDLVSSPFDFWDRNPDGGVMAQGGFARMNFDHGLELAHEPGGWRSPFDERYRKIDALGISGKAFFLTWGESLSFP